MHGRIHTTASTSMSSVILNQVDFKHFVLTGVRSILEEALRYLLCNTVQPVIFAVQENIVILIIIVKLCGKKLMILFH